MRSGLHVGRLGLAPASRGSLRPKGPFQRFKIQEASKIIGMRRSVRRPPGDARGIRASAIRVPRSGMGIGPLALLVALHDFVRFVEPPTATRHGVKRIHRVTRTLRPPLGLGAGERVVCASLTPGDHARESPWPCAPQWRPGRRGPWPILWRYKVPDTIVFCRGEIY